MVEAFRLINKLILNSSRITPSETYIIEVNDG